MKYGIAEITQTGEKLTVRQWFGWGNRVSLHSLGSLEKMRQTLGKLEMENKGDKEYHIAPMHQLDEILYDCKKCQDTSDQQKAEKLREITKQMQDIQI